MKPASSSRFTLTQCLPWLALLCSMLLFGLHFFLGGGRTKLINDSRAYLVMTQGERAGTPFDSRVLAPFIAKVITSVSDISGPSSFQILTFASLIAALLLLRKIVGDRGGSVEWQAAVLMALGCGLAATFGYVPVMVDPLLLALACLTVLAMDRNYWLAVFALSSLAALTKEYGILLGLVSGVVAWRRNRRKFAVIGVFLPFAALLITILIGSRSQGAIFDAWHNFINGMFGYHAYLIQFRGAFDYIKILYMWSWSVLWPLLIIAAWLVLSRLRASARMSDDESAFSLMLLTLPILLLGDWGRALLIVVPLGCAVATAHPLTRNARFAALLAVGGLSTALARPFHGESPPPQAFLVTMTIISVTSSLVIGVTILRYAPSAAAASQLDSGLENSAPEVAVR